MKLTKTKKRLLKLTALLLLLVFMIFYPFGKPERIQYIDRATGDTLVEKVPGEFWLYWLYNNPVGELSLETIIKRKIISSFYGRLMDKPSSAKRIEPFVKKYGIDLSIAQKQKFNSFNDFFTRKLKPGVRPVDTSKTAVVSPADGKAFAWSVIRNTNFIVKGHKFNLKNFLQNDTLFKKFKNGSLLLFRLSPADYHRFHFPVDGKIIAQNSIKGDYYSVSPHAVKNKIRIFCENKRMFTLIKTELFGDVLMSEIGATMVGTIIQTYTGDTAVKGAEKGYFKFGGSSIILLFEKNRVKIDEDLLINTSQGYETSVKVGEHVAEAVKK